MTNKQVDEFNKIRVNDEILAGSASGTIGQLSTAARKLANPQDGNDIGEQIGNALAALTGRGVVTLLPGEYSGASAIDFSGAGYRGLVGTGPAEAADIVFDGAISRAIDVSNATAVDIRNVTLDGNADGVADGVKVDTSASVGNLTIDGCLFRDFGQDAIYNGSKTVISNSTFQSIEGRAIAVDGGYWSISEVTTGSCFHPLRVVAGRAYADGLDSFQPTATNAWLQTGGELHVNGGKIDTAANTAFRADGGTVWIDGLSVVSPGSRGIHIQGADAYLNNVDVSGADNNNALIVVSGKVHITNSSFKGLATNLDIRSTEAELWNVDYDSLSDSGTRTMINGKSTQNATPGSGTTGDEWGGHAALAHRKGITVEDTSVTAPYDLYKADSAGNWVQIG